MFIVAQTCLPDIYIDLLILFSFNYCIAFPETELRPYTDITTKGSPYLKADQPKAVRDLARVHW